MEFGLSLVGKGRIFVDGRLALDNGWTTTQTRGQTFYGLGTIEEICEVEVIQDRVYEIRVEYTNHPTITDSAKTGNGIKSTHIVKKLDGANGADLNDREAIEVDDSLEADDDEEDAAGGQPPLMMAALRLGGAMQVQPAKAIEDAVKLVSETDAAILVCGTSLDWEAEAGDRALYSLPGQTDELIRKVLEANPNTVIVNQSVSRPALKHASGSVLIVFTSRRALPSICLGPTRQPPYFKLGLQGTSAATPWPTFSLAKLIPVDDYLFLSISRLKIALRTSIGAERLEK